MQTGDNNKTDWYFSVLVNQRLQASTAASSAIQIPHVAYIADSIQNAQAEEQRISKENAAGQAMRDKKRNRGKITTNCSAPLSQPRPLWFAGSR